MIVDALKNRITNIGRLGENESRVIRFPVDDIIAEFPNCVFSLLHRRKGDPSAYPVPVTRFIVDGGWLYWTVTSGDVAIEGNGKCQIVASEDGKIRKTDTYLTRVDSALDGSGTPPDPWASWQQDVVNAADRAEAAAEFLKNANAEAVELPAGSQPTANYADGTFTFGLVTGPMGATGPVGATGATGAPGVFTDLIDDNAGSSVENRTWSAKKLSEEFSGKYTKPTSGIPASDIEEGVIPQVPVKDVKVYGTSVVNEQGEAMIPRATDTKHGVVKYGDFGITVDSNGVIKISRGTASDIQSASNSYKPVVADLIHYAAFYGLAKAAGVVGSQASKNNTYGTYTELGKSKIAQMLNAPESVSGATPTIVGKAGIQYICGECATLSVIAPSSGCIDILFESGSTPTVLTITSAKTGVTAVKWANGFDPTDLDANTTYELNILDGEFGVVASWT